MGFLFSETATKKGESIIEGVEVSIFQELEYRFDPISCELVGIV